MKLNVCPFDKTEELKMPDFIWCGAVSLLIQVTEAPALTVTTAGSNEKFDIATAAGSKLFAGFCVCAGICPWLKGGVAFWPERLAEK